MYGTGRRPAETSDSVRTVPLLAAPFNFSGVRELCLSPLLCSDSAQDSPPVHSERAIGRWDSPWPLYRRRG